MNARKLTFMLTALLISSVAFCQDYAFKVLANKGSNEFKSGSSWQPLKTGASLKTTDELKLAENAYIGLVSSNGKPMELKQAGNYKVADLANLTLPPNQSSGLYNNKAIIRWNTKASGPYVVTFRNLFDDVLDQMETPENHMEIDLGSKSFATESAILVEVSAKADPKVVSEQHLIKKLTPAQHESVKKSLSEISGELNEPTALNKLILAGFYEENNLLIDAITAYEEAVKLAPDVPSYKEDYDEFLIRHALKN
jgi:hypothetical protein